MRSIGQQARDGSSCAGPGRRVRVRPGTGDCGSPCPAVCVSGKSFIWYDGTVAETRNDGALDLLPDMPPLESTKAAEATKSPETPPRANRPKKSKDPKTLK